MKQVRKTYCISHGKDVDGIASASIVKLANGAKTYLVNYDKIIQILEKIPDNAELYVCDLGMNNRTINEFINQDELIELMKQNNFQNCNYRNLSGGIVAIHSGWKI